MSWFSNLANSLREEDDEHDSPEQNANHQHKDQSSLPEEEEEDPSRGGVKEDLSELTKTLTRQLWGVASFLAPPPPPPQSHQSPPPPPPLPSDPGRIAGIRSDFAEIGGRFRNEISRLSSHKAVSEISKIASTFLPFGSEDQEDLGDFVVGDAVGVTKEVLAFARNIAMHPETWLDFPLVDDDDSDDFDMSDVQQEHALAVERLSPRLAALRIELCPRHMSEGCFWKIYFVLLHPRLSKHDAELLSTPQIVEARALLTHDLQNRTKSQELYGKGISYSNESSSLPEDHYSSSNAPNETAMLKTFVCDTSNLTSTTDVETEKHAVVSTEMQMVDKSVVEEGPAPPKNKDILVGSSSKYLDEKYEDDGDDWLEDENSEMGGYSRTDVPLGNEEDVSFSDLEDDDDDSKVLPAGSKAATTKSSKESQDWVQLNRNSADSRGTGHTVSDNSSNNDQSNKDTNEWLDVDTKDVV